MIRSNWSNDIYARGAYTFHTVNSTDSLMELFEEGLGERVFFAGEHTNYKYRGTVHGIHNIRPL